jgi:hypothetical protein
MVLRFRLLKNKPECQPLFWKKSMTKLWQLKRLSSGESLSEAQLLPENWGPVFGLANFEDKLGDLSWIGPEHVDTGWFVVGELPVAPEATPADLAWEQAKKLLRESDWTMLPDVPITTDKRREWEEWRRFVREIRMHPDWPNVVIPPQPE